MLRRPALCLLLLTLPLSAQTTTNQAAARATKVIQTDDLRADLSFLASEDLAGRNIGTAEDHIATDYIAAEFMRLGLKPMGDDGTFFQKMEIVTGNLDAEHTSLTATINGSE